MPSLVLPMTLPMSAVGDPEVFHDFKVGQFPVNGTFARASTVNGWTLDANGDPVLTEFAIDAPAFVIDPATGQRLGYRALAGFTNSLLWSRDLSNAVWTTGTLEGLTQDEVGIDGQDNIAWTLTDNDVNQTSRAEQNFTVADNTATHSGLFFVKKEDDESSFPACSLDFLGGTAVMFRAMINKKTGAIQAINDASAADVSILGAGDFWRVEIQATNNGTGNTTLRKWILPAYSTTFGTNEASATGSCVYDFGGVYLNSSIAGPPIETEGSPVSTDPDDGTESVPTSLQSAGTLVISARTANGLSGDQVLAQMDDGTENNRVRLVRNGSREVRYIVTDGGTEVANLNLGTVADDTDTKVAIRYGDDDYAGIISGGTLQTDTTGTMPSISTLRHGRDTADGEEWNGTIANVRGDDAYTDSQLEGAV